MSLALVTTFFSHAPKAERFNNVIDDFDTYLQLEKEGKVQEQKQQLPVNTQNQGYDIFSSLSTVPAPNEKQKSAAANKGTKGKNSGKKKSVAASNKKNDVAKTEAENSDTTTFPEVCAVTTENVVAPVLLSSYPYFFQSNQWNPAYLAKDFAKYQLVLDPLGLYSSKYTKPTGIDASAYLEQLAKLIERQQLTNLYKFGIAKGVGQLIAYNNLLNDDQLVAELINHNKSIAQLTHTITEKQFEIDKLNAEVLKNKEQIAQLQAVLDSSDDQSLIDTLNTKLAEAQKAIEQKQNSLEQLSQENQQTQETIAQLENQLNDSITEQSKLKQQLAEKEQLFVAANLKIEQLTADIAKLELDAKNQLQMAGNTDEQIKSVTAELLQQKELLKQKESELAAVQSQKDDVQVALKAQQDSAKLLEQQNQQLQSQLVEKEQLAEKIQASLAEKTLQAEQKAALEVALKEAQEQLNNHQTTQNTLAKQLVDSEKQQARLQAQLSQNEQNYSVAQAQLKQANAELQKLQANVEKQTALIGQANDKQIKELTADLNKQITLLKQKEVALTKLDAEKKSIQGELATQQNESKKLEQQLTDANKLISTLKVDSQKELAAAQTKLKKLQRELDSLNSVTGDNALKSQIMDLNRRITQLQVENDALKAKGRTSSTAGLAGRALPSKDLKVIAAENAKKNQKIIEQITAQKYSKLDSNTYYKIIQAGSPIKNVKSKDVTFIMREQLTDGKVTVMYTEQNPVTLPYDQLPTPLNSFVERAGEGGMVKVYIKPEGGYGVEGIPGEVPPNSMSIIDLKIIKAK
ncbi:hypothetical protein [Providencia sp. PROV167]|uniref:hypothetical protein n=1 Tax=Providencia sp. PROV167 TaxID=2949873 RepID=UPI00234AB625|nr:hypothetical protein [Providencia sp. PROV167]